MGSRRKLWLNGKMLFRMPCAECGTLVTLENPRDSVWTAFCSPEHAKKWQDERTEEEILEREHRDGATTADRCQWCHCRLHTGYHEPGCPVREVEDSPSPPT